MLRNTINRQHLTYRAMYKDGFCISTEKARLDIPAIHHFLSAQSYWSLNIPYTVVEEAIEHSLNFGLYEKEKQIGFARIITDFSTVAYLGDVYVLPEYRERGLSKWLMQTIMDYPEPVSYTHLRAHETDSYLVCRLLLEKK